MFCSRCGSEVDDQAKFCGSCGLDLASTTPLAALQDQGERSEASEIEAVQEALKDEWQIDRELGRGGMAIVYKARDKHLERDVAIKVLPFSLAFDKEFVERFQREARTAAKLEHPHIIPIYRVGKSGRVIYFVMKFLRGNSLSEVLEGRGKLQPDEIRRLLIEASGALGYAHRHGIVHRDIKPDNIMFDEVGHAVITDFGIAKAATGTRLTGTGMSIGTPHYMSPEQARAQKLDGRSDLYSLGVVAYQCLTGHVPFDGEDAFSIGYKHIMEEVPMADLQTPEQRDLFRVIVRMMAKTTDERFQTAEELVALLEGRPTATRPAPLATGASEAPTTIIPTPPGGTLGMPGAHPSTPTTPMPKVQAGEAKEKKKRSGVLVGMLLLLFLGGGGAGGYWYFVMGAEWPLPFMAQREAPPAVTPPPSDDSLQLAVADSLGVAAGDSGAAMADDTTAAAPPPISELPQTGVIVLTNLRRLSRVELDGQAMTGNTFTVDPGTHRVVARRSGFQDFSWTGAVERGDTVTLRVEMPPIQVDYCADPGAEYNQDGSCYDTAPAATAACILNRPEGAAQRLSVVLWVKVDADGRRETDRRPRETGNLAFTIAALRMAREMQYTPAQKDGRPVAAWLRLRCVSR